MAVRDTVKDTRILVTGGAGFVGSHVTENLVSRGASVTTVDNLSAGEQKHIPEEAAFHNVDIRDRDALTEVVHEVDPEVVIHLAAIHFIPYCNEHPEEAFDVNVMGTRNLLDATEGLENLERIVYTSTAAVYPPDAEPHSEDDSIGPMDIYGRTKLVGEDLLELFVNRTGTPAASARLFNVYGPNETNPHLIPAILEQVEDGSEAVLLGNLSPKRDFIWAGDVADALIALAFNHDSGHRSYNVGTGTAWSVREVAEKVGTALDRDLTVEQESERVRESDRPHLCADASRIEEEIGWSAQTGFVDGLRALLESEGIK